MKTDRSLLASATLIFLLGACASTVRPPSSASTKQEPQKTITSKAAARQDAKLPAPDSSRARLESIKRKLPETISPLTATQLDTKVPHSYYFDYDFEPQPGKRIWRRVDSKTWHEIYPDGLTSVFKVLGHAIVSETEGTIVVKWSGDTEKTMTTNDGGLQAFIPDLSSATMHHWYRNTDRGDTTWNDLAPMKDVK